MSTHSNSYQQLLFWNIIYFSDFKQANTISELFSIAILDI